MSNAGTSCKSVGFSDATTKTFVFGSLSTHTSISDINFLSGLNIPFFYQAANYTDPTSGGVIKIGSDFWRSENAQIYKYNTPVVISGTTPSGDSSLGHDVTNSYLLVQNSSTAVYKYSGISGTTITYVGAVTLDNAVDTTKGFIYDNTNQRYIFIDGTDLRRFNSVGTTIDTVSLGSVVPSGLNGLIFINDRIYLVCLDPWQTVPNSITLNFFPTTMTR